MQQYRMTAKPVGKLQDKVDLAVDSIVQLTLGGSLLAALCILALCLKSRKLCSYLSKAHASG